MALKKKNKFAQLRAAIKRQKARDAYKKNAPKAKGNRKITRADPKSKGSTLKTRLKQKALNIKGKAKAAVRNAPKNIAKAKSAVKAASRKVDTKMERKALLGKAKKAVSSKAKSVGSAAKKQATFRLNKLTGTGTKGRSKMAASAKSSVSKKFKSVRGKAADVKKAVSKNVRTGLNEAVRSKQTPKSGAAKKPTTRLGKLMQKGRGLKRKVGSMSAAHRKAISDGLKKRFGSRGKK